MGHGKKFLYNLAHDPPPKTKRIYFILFFRILIFHSLPLLGPLWMPLLDPGALKGMFRQGVATKANMSYVACKLVLKAPQWSLISKQPNSIH